MRNKILILVLMSLSFFSCIQDDDPCMKTTCINNAQIRLEFVNANEENVILNGSIANGDIDIINLENQNTVNFYLDEVSGILELRVSDFNFDASELGILVQGEEVANIKFLVVDTRGECCGGINFEEVEILGANYIYDEYVEVYRIHIDRFFFRKNSRFFLNKM